MKRSDPVRELLRRRGAAEHVVRGGLAGLVRAWEETASAAAAGYELSLDDWLNDMDVRQSIAEAVAGTGVRLPSRLGGRLSAADEAFVAATRPVGGCLWGSEVAVRNGWNEIDNWWYFRVPLRPGAELAADLSRRDDRG